MSSILAQFKECGLRRIGLILTSRSITFRTRNPGDPHFDRKRMIEVCKPMFIPDKRHELETCASAVLVSENAVHPYHRILCNELKMSWEASPVRMIFHLNSAKEKYKKEVRNMFFKKDLFLHIYPNEVLKLAFTKTPFESVLHLFESSSCLVFGSKLSQLSDVLKLSKKTQYVFLLGGIIEDAFYSQEQLQKISRLDREKSHQELARNLECIASSTCGSLSHHTNVLSRYLTELSNEKS
ncbi:39S ribosomal protein L10, mitochondrial-like [Uloborus diversus]|uniref:39S ribosomal protein L10, mitochondrial-like n=1 Tax=Uloborus diversus TaxID=327109 RepID=UPI002409A3DD|nr:39S ribosomal protein L10, mitochondrial-like [Uloborus diversus]